MELEKRIQELEKKYASSNPEAEIELAQIIQLPLWSDPKRAVPNGVLRSALFGVVGRGRRRYLERESMASVDGIEVTYTGMRLDQADLDVWEQCLQIARDQPLGTQISITAHSFLKAIGRSTGKSAHEWLKNITSRLSATTVEITQGRWTYGGSLVDEFYRDDATGRYVITLNPKLVALFQPDGYTEIEWEQRRALKKQPLAQWLHGFYSSHAKAHPIKVSTLRDLSGSENSQLRGFRRDLKQALEALETATGWKWKIEDDKVFIEREPSASQKRHLAKRSYKRKMKLDTNKLNL